MLGAIWAQSRDGIIGDGDDMPWHVPEDLVHFREITHGAPVIMGRRTWESIPGKFRPLKGRDNYVVSSRAPGDWSAGATVIPSPAGIDGWVMGGARLYGEAVDIVDRIELTVMDCEMVGELGSVAVRAPAVPGDFELVDDSGWRLSERGRLRNGAPVRYRFIRYERNNKGS